VAGVGPRDIFDGAIYSRVWVVVVRPDRIDRSLREGSAKVAEVLNSFLTLISLGTSFGLCRDCPDCPDRLFPIFPDPSWLISSEKKRGPPRHSRARPTDEEILSRRDSLRFCHSRIDESRIRV
jgi:hypothetical protein